MKFQRQWYDSNRWETITKEQFINAYKSMDFKPKYLKGALLIGETMRTDSAIYRVVKKEQ